MKKKIGNTFNPYALPARKIGHRIGHTPQPFDVLYVAKRMLTMSLVLCLFYACVLAIQGFAQASATWCAMGWLIRVGPYGMANTKRDVQHQKKLHFVEMGCFAGQTMLLAWTLVPVYPWLVSACLAACLLLHVYVGQHVFRPVVDSLPAPCRHTQTKHALGAASLGFVFLMLIPTPFGPLATPALGVLIFWHGWRLWHRLRRQALSEDQHADIWPPALNDAQTSAQAWITFKQYIFAETISRKALRAVIWKVNNPDALLAYFATVPGDVGTLTSTNIALLVQERLSECEPCAAMVFSMESDPYEAARIIAKMRRGEQEAAKTLALPDLEENPHAA